MKIVYSGPLHADKVQINICTCPAYIQHIDELWHIIRCPIDIYSSTFSRHMIQASCFGVKASSFKGPVHRPLEGSDLTSPDHSATEVEAGTLGARMSWQAMGCTHVIAGRLDGKSRSTGHRLMSSLATQPTQVPWLPIGTQLAWQHGTTAGSWANSHPIAMILDALNPGIELHRTRLGT